MRSCSFSLRFWPGAACGALLMGWLSLAGRTELSAAEAKTYTQKPEIAPAVERGVEAPAATPASPDHLFAGGTVPHWIWGADENRTYVLRLEFEAPADLKQAVVRFACDNVATLFLNDKRVASNDNWQTATEADLKPSLRPGKNVLSAEVRNEGGPAAFVLKAALVKNEKEVQYIVTDDKWQAAEKKDAAGQPVRVIGKLGIQPWGDSLAQGGPASQTPRDMFEVPAGFQVERLFTVPKEELGSWVNLTVDSRGRLIVSDQGNLGLCRVTPPPVGSNAETKVERLPVQISAAQGLLFAFDSLYVSVNGGPGSGLYRVRDTNNDDQFDEVVKLREFRGGGEHGPHALRLSPDGKSIYVTCGNHTLPPSDVIRNGEPQRMGGARAEPLRALLPDDMTSRIAPNWDEDLLLPRQWDANGHAVGILSPGGWVASTDPEGKRWDIVSVGYRNQFDMDFNADGELFVYDADMEWDLGSPWYRPTRVVHATSGSEFGWRSGTGKWPGYYVDSLPPLVDIGPGSPVGVTFGYGAKFPAKYQKALYLCDWTFGTMYCVHLTPDGASYKGVKEEFVARTPLPLTDAVIGKDGAMYFTIGGRGTQSELFRVTYVGKESTAPVDAKDAQGAEERALRRKIEQYQQAAPGQKEPAASADAVSFLWPHLSHKDRFVRYAARVALERQPVASWVDRLWSEKNPSAVITASVALARQGEKSHQSKLLEALHAVPVAALSESQQLELARAYQLAFIRLGEPSPEAAAAAIKRLDPLFPSSNQLLNRELCILLVFLKAPSVAGKTTALLTSTTAATEGNDLEAVLARNPGYGGAVSATLKNAVDQQQMHYVFSLRNLAKPWTLDERKVYFGWFNEARTKSGGASFQGFLRNIEKDALENTSEPERLQLEALGVRKPFPVATLPKAQGPGREWGLAELLPLQSTHLKGRDFKNGQKMFAAARCVVCHRFGGEGGATGPDLTQLAGRFNYKDLLEAIVDPSKVISDQYKATIVLTTGGQQYTGRLLRDDDDSLTLLTDAEDASKQVTIPKKEIEDRQPATASIMPKDLLKTLNQDEVLDLMAYLLSRGNAGDAMFRK